MAKPQSNRHKAKPCSLSPERLNIWWLCTSPHNTMSARRSWPTSVSCLIETAPEGNPRATGTPTRSAARPHGRLTLRTERQNREHRQEGQGHSTVLSRPERDSPQSAESRAGHPRARSPGSQERGAVLEPLQWPEQQQRHRPFARCARPSQEETVPEQRKQQAAHACLCRRHRVGLRLTPRVWVTPRARCTANGSKRKTDAGTL